MITQNYKLDLIPSGDPLIVHVSQYDTTARTLSFDLYNGGVAFTMPEGATATINGTKPDGTAFMYQMTTSGTEATIQLQQQMALIAGDTTCEIQITGSGGGKLGTANFILRVERAAIDENTVISDTDLPIFEELASSAQESAATASAAATTATTAAGQVASIVPSNTGTTGQVLTKAASGATWEDPVVPQEALLINITQSGSTYTADKTFQEIADAVALGIYPMVKYGMEIYKLGLINTGYSDPYARFDSNSGTYFFGIYIYNSGTVQRMKNPGYNSANITLLASGWNNGVYTASTSLATAASLNSRQSVTMPSTRTLAQYRACAAAKISVGFSAGQIIFTANGTVPTIDIPILYEKWTV